MSKLYVTGSKAVMIPGYGTKQPGDYFEMSADETTAFANHPGLSKTAPKSTKQTPVKPVESEDNES